MAKFNLTLPKMGESVDEATIVSWLKNVGDEVSADDFVVEIATDKEIRIVIIAPTVKETLPTLKFSEIK